MTIRDLRNTSEISELAHRKQEPIFITKNGYSDLVGKQLIAILTAFLL